MTINTRRTILAGLVAAMVVSLTPVAPAYAGGEGGGGEDKQGIPINMNKNAKNNALKVDGQKNGRRASPREWEMRDRSGKKTTTVRRSRITGRYTLSQYGRDRRNGRNVPVRVRTFSENEWRRMTSFNPRTNTTTITVGRGNRARTHTVSGDATPPARAARR